MEGYAASCCVFPAQVILFKPTFINMFFCNLRNFLLLPVLFNFMNLNLYGLKTEKSKVKTPCVYKATALQLY